MSFMRLGRWVHRDVKPLYQCYDFWLTFDQKDGTLIISRFSSEEGKRTVRWCGQIASSDLVANDWEVVIEKEKT